MPTGNLDLVVARIAAEQAGPFTRRQTDRAGMSRDQVQHRIRSGLWVALYPGVYVTASTPITPALRAKAALMYAGERAVLSHRSAAVAWKLDGVTATTPEITVPGTEHPRARDLVVHRSSLEPPDICHDVPRRTSAARTIIDIAGVVDAATLEVAFESARRRRLVSVAAVRARLEPIAGRGRRGATTLRTLLDTLDGCAPAESVLEVKAARVLRRASLPEPVRQHAVATFGQRYRLDFAWPASRVALELDGRAHHGDANDFQRDRTRWSDLASAGWHVVIATWDDVTRRPADVVARLANLLRA